MNRNSYYIYSDQVFIGGELQPASLAIHRDKIIKIHLGQKKEEAIDYSGKVVMSGVIDAHVHINEPGRTTWEGFETATKAAVRGGITTIIDMPLNSSPVVTNITAFKKKLAAAKDKLYTNCGFWAGATKASISDVKSLIEAGCLGVKVFISDSGIKEFPNIPLAELDKLMGGIAHLNIPVLAHCELDNLPAANKLAAYPRSYNAYLKSRPKAWENEAIKAFIALAEKHNCKAHIVHLASDEMIDWIYQKKQTTIPFTVETCPHYFFFHAEEILDGATLFKCAPPIRDKQNGQHLKKALKEGIIDFISSDHSPAPPNIKELKSGNFAKAWGGIAGLQFLLPASWTALKEDLSLEEFIPLLTSKPADFLGLADKIGTIKEGFIANLTIWQPKVSFQVKKELIEHRHKATPYLHRQLFGAVAQTIINGQMALNKDKIVQTPFGRKCLHR